MSDREELLERQTEALEAIATELRYQNAVLVEQINAVDHLARRVDENHFDGGEPRNRSVTAHQTAVADHLHERDQQEDSPMSSLGAAENWGDR